MINFIVLGKCKRVVSAVLQAIRGFTDAKCVVIGGPETRIFRWSALCKRQITIDLNGTDDDRFIREVYAIFAHSPHVMLMPVDCDGVRLANRVRDRLPVAMTPIPNVETLDMFDDKWRFHQFCTQHGLPVPETRFFASKSALDYETAAADLGVPFVVKPLNMAGSTGVCIVRGKDDYEKSIRDNPAYEYGSLIAQRYIDGVDIDISFLSIGGRMAAFAVQQIDASRVVFCANAELEALAATLCEAGAYHGVMHVDARMETATGKVFLIESNPRFWASLTASVWCGLNFVAESLLPSARTIGVRRLSAGAVSIRNPLLRPSTWGMLLSDSSARGRLMRAMAFDPPALGAFMREVPLTFSRYVARRVRRDVDGPATTSKLAPCKPQ